MSDSEPADLTHHANERWDVRELTDYLAALAIASLCTLVNWPLSAHLGQTSILLVYLLGVCTVAANFGLWPSIFESLLSMVGFAYFYAPPLFSLAIADTENLAALAMLLVVALVTSTLMAKVRTQAVIASRREQRATGLYQLSHALAPARSEQDAVDTALRHINTLCGPSRLILATKAGALVLPDSALPPMYVETARDTFQRRSVVRNPVADGTGRTVLGLPLLTGIDCVGVLLLEDGGNQRLTHPEQLQYLDVLLSLVAQSIERVRLTEQAREASIKAETEAVRNSLLSAVSHDLRTPLTAILGAAGTLVQNESTFGREQRLELIQAIQEEAQSMCDLTDKILDMAKVSAGKLPLARDWNVLEEIVGGALSRAEKSLHGRPVNIQLPDTVPLIYVDAVLLQQVLINLFDNATKYSPNNSPIDIQASVMPEGLSLSVADRGPGLPIHAKNQIFEKFFRLHPESKPGGVGLGLAICRAIVEAHGGSISANNRLGGGTIFNIALPLEREHPPQPPNEAEEETSI